MVEILDEEFASGETTQGLIVYQRDGGLTAADREKIAADAEATPGPVRRGAAADQPAGDPVRSPRRQPPRRRRSRRTATSPTPCSPSRPTSTGGRLGQERPRRHRRGQRAASRSSLTGDLGFCADAEEVFGELDTKLLLATVLLVLVLLGAIYRAVLVALTPAGGRLLRLHGATAFIYLYAKCGRDRLLERDHDPDRADVRGGDRLLPVVRLQIPRGAAPDRGQARGDGAGGARAPGPTILASGLTVSLAMLVARRSPTPAHAHARAGGGDRRRLRDGRRADAAPGAADDLRPPRVLAAAEHGRVRPRHGRLERAPGRLAALRRSRAAAARRRRWP